MNGKTVGFAMAMGMLALAGTADDAYVEFTGRQYVSTGIALSSKSRIELDVEMTDFTRQDRVLYDSSATGFHLYVNGDATPHWGFTFRTPGGANPWESIGAPVKKERQRLILDMKNGCAKCINADGTTYVKYVSAGLDACDTLYIGGDQLLRMPSMKIYSLKIYDDDVLMRDFIPALCNGSVCLYDRVSSISAMDMESCNADKDLGSGGDIEEIPTPYVESSGVSGMNMRIVPDLNTRLEMDFALCEIKAQDRLFGAVGNGNGMSMYVSGSPSRFSASYTTNKFLNSKMLCDLKRHTVVYDYPALQMTMKTGFESNTNGVISFAEKNIVPGQGNSAALTLFAASADPSGVDFGLASRRPKMRVYGVRVYQSGELIHDYMPLVKGSVAGFRDRVDGAFVTGEETDTFTVGGEVSRVSDDGYVKLPDENDGQLLAACTISNKFIFLDYKPGPTTRVELDYAFSHNVTNGSCSLFSCYIGKSGTSPAERFYIAAESNKYELRSGTGNWTTITELISTKTAKDVRRTAVLDAKSSRALLVTAGYTNFVKNSSTTLTRTSPTNGLRLGSNWDTPAGWVTPLKIYGCKIYEDDALVRNYVPYVKGGVPGLKDSLTDDFGRTTNSSNAWLLVDAGGAIAGDAACKDAYVEFTGSQLIVTDYKPNARTHIVADLQCTCTSPKQQRFWYSTGNIENHFYVNGSFAFAFSYNKSAVWQSSGLSVTDSRALIDFDSENKKLVFTVDGVVTDKSSCWDSMTDYNYQSTGYLNIGGWGSTSSSPGARMRLYGFKIYEGETLMRNFVPYKSGDTIALCDLVSGKVFTVDDADNRPPLKIGGQSAALTVAPTDTVIPVEQSATLRAFAVGAVSYRWYLDGTEIDGETSDSLVVYWKKRQHADKTYSVLPVYTVFGETVLGDPASCTVTYSERGMLFLIR